MVQKKVGISKEKLEIPVRNAIGMFFSFLFGSSFPIAPFVFMSVDAAAITSSALTICALFGMGMAKAKFTKLNRFKSGLEVVLIGLGAGVIGYLVGLAFAHL